MEQTLRLQNSILYQALVRKDNDGKLSSLVLKTVEHISPLLCKIPENMPEFTLHDPAHSAKIIEIMAKILPTPVLDGLNAIEVALLILSAYLHDVGMTSDRKEKEKIISSDEDFNILFKSNIDKFQKFEQYKLEGNHRASTFIQDQIFTEYLRRNHVKRSALFIATNLNSGEHTLSYQGIPFYKLLIKICDGHGESVQKLKDNTIWPRETLIGENIVNVQFLSLILRLADILDLDSERTPKVIYEFVNPEDPISILEWKKHRSIIGTSFTDKKILFEAECSSPEVERALKQFMDWIELERKETMELLKTYEPEIATRYYLLLEDEVTKHRIYSDGTYVYNDLMFSLDYQRIMSLLMGQKLYKDPITALRELLQNSIDAIKVRQKVYESKLEKFLPLIHITLQDEILIIEDNGIGMNQRIFENYFLQIGKSYYSSPVFYNKFSEIDVTSEFGIGILSVFMIASSFNVESRREPENPLQPFEPIDFEIPAAQSYIVQRSSNRLEIGTKITLKLKESNPFKKNDLRSILEEIIPNPPFPIKMTKDKTSEIYDGKKIKEIDELKYENLEVEKFLKVNRIEDFNWDNKFTHSLLTVNFEASEDTQLKDIKGELKLVNANGINYYSTFNGILCQRSFSVGFPETSDNKFLIKPTESVQGLFPKWLSYYSNLNLSGIACLSVTPDRCDFTIDEKYKILKSKIEKKIIEELDDHLTEYDKKWGTAHTAIYIDFLYYSGFFGFDLNEVREGNVISEEAKSFFYKWITFPILNNTGKVERARSSYLNSLENLGIIETKINSDQISLLRDFKTNNNLEIILLGNFEYNSHRNETLLLGVFGSTKHFLKPVKLLLRPLLDAPIYLHRYKTNQIDDENDYDLINLISNGENIDDDISVVFRVRNEYMHPQWNISNSLISFLFLNPSLYSAGKKDLIKKLTIEIRTSLEESVNILKNSVNPEHIKIGYSEHCYVQTRNILNYNPKLFNSIDQILSTLWEEAKKIGILSNNDNYPGLKLENLPWFWNE